MTENIIYQKLYYFLISFINIETHFFRIAFPGENIGVTGLIWSAYSNVSGAIYGSILAIDTHSIVKLQSSVAYLDQRSHDTIQMFDDSYPETLTLSSPDKFQLWQTSPTFMFRSQTFTVLGEIEKLVPFSPTRFQNFDVSDNDVVLQLMTGSRERINFQV